ncbi:hypothetical protein SUGI_0068910 [Cryptomeria japonica]|nr:hypothetical protein SUGI_0068910 [Cryptomeria japonica]
MTIATVRCGASEVLGRHELALAFLAASLDFLEGHIVVSMAAILGHSNWGFHGQHQNRPGSHREAHCNIGDPVMLWVNKVGPYNNPQETYNYSVSDLGFPVLGSEYWCFES